MTKLLRLKQVTEATGLSRSSIYALAKVGRFPRPIKLTEKASAWLEEEVREWIISRIARSRNPQSTAI